MSHWGVSKNRQFEREMQWNDRKKVLLKVQGYSDRQADGDRQ